MKKITIPALVLVVCLAALGVGYAKWTDDINIKGKVHTGSVDLVVDNYSGTYVYKDLETHDLIYSYPAPATNTDNLELIASSFAGPCTRDVECIDPDCVQMTWDNIFPGCKFKADAVFHYVGSIPAVVDNITCIIEPPPWIEDYIQVQATIVDSEDEDRIGDIVCKGYQLHYCDYVELVVTIELPQDNDLMNRCAFAFCKITVAQWAECPNGDC